MKSKHLAVGMTEHASAVLEWTTGADGICLTLLESGERFENEALTMGASGELGTPASQDLTVALLELLNPTLISTRTADELWASARFGLLRWYSAVDLPGSDRAALEKALEQTVWA